MHLKTILNILSEYNLSADELLLTYLTFIAQTENGDPEINLKYFAQWYESGGKINLKNLFTSLKEKGIIVKNYNPDAYMPNEIEFNKNFIKKYFKLTGELGNELRAIYPDMIIINNSYASLKNISKRFLTWDEFNFWYASTIKHNIDKHKEIINILQWAKEKDLVRCSIIEFVASHKWHEFKQIKDSGIDILATTFDTFTSV